MCVDGAIYVNFFGGLEKESRSFHACVYYPFPTPYVLIVYPVAV